MDDKTFEEELNELAKQRTDLINEHEYLYCILDIAAVKMHEDINYARLMGYSNDDLTNLALEHVKHMNAAIEDYVRKMNARNS